MEYHTLQSHYNYLGDRILSMYRERARAIHERKVFLLDDSTDSFIVAIGLLACEKRQIEERIRMVLCYGKYTQAKSGVRTRPLVRH